MEVHSELLYRVAPGQGRKKFFSDLMRSDDANKGKTDVDNRTPYFIKYMKKSNTDGHEKDDVFALFKKSDPGRIIEKIRVIDGVESSTKDDLEDLFFEVKKGSNEWQPVDAYGVDAYGLKYRGGRRRKNRSRTKKVIHKRRRYSRKN